MDCRLLRNKLWLVLLIFSTILHAQNPDEAARGGTSIADSGLWAAAMNPAAAISNGKLAIGVAYRNYYFVSELHSANILCNVQTSRGAFFCMFTGNTGYPAWFKQQLSIAYALKLHQNFRLGISFLWNKTIMTGIEAHNSIFPILGFLYAPQLPFSLGFGVHNPFLWQSDKNPISVRLGIQSSYWEQCKISLQCDKDLQNSPVIRLGCAYTVHQCLVVKLGFSTSNLPLTYGFGLLFNTWQTNLAIEQHRILGVLPSISIAHQF